MTSAGLNSVLEKYTTPNTGAVLVHGKDQPVLPAEASDVPLEETVKVRLCRSASASCSRTVKTKLRVALRQKEAGMASIIQDWKSVYGSYSRSGHTGGVYWPSKTSLLRDETMRVIQPMRVIFIIYLDPSPI